MRPIAPYMAPLVSARKRAGLNQATVGERLGVSTATVSNLETGVSQRLDLIDRYANLFDLMVDIQFKRVDQAA